MNLSLIHKQQRRQVWADMVMRCRNSGLTITDWCQAEGISLATYHYRQRQVMDLVSEQGFRPATEFVQLPLAAIDQPVVTSCITMLLPYKRNESTVAEKVYQAVERHMEISP